MVDGIFLGPDLIRAQIELLNKSLFQVNEANHQTVRGILFLYDWEDTFSFHQLSTLIIQWRILSTCHALQLELIYSWHLYNEAGLNSSLLKFHFPGCLLGKCQRDHKSSVWAIRVNQVNELGLNAQLIDVELGIFVYLVVSNFKLHNKVGGQQSFVSCESDLDLWLWLLLCEGKDQIPCYLSEHRNICLHICGGIQFNRWLLDSDGLIG